MDSENYNDFEYWKNTVLTSNDLIDDDIEENVNDDADDEKKTIINFLYYENKFNSRKHKDDGSEEDNYLNDKFSSNYPKSFSFVSIDCNFNKSLNQVDDGHEDTLFQEPATNNLINSSSSLITTTTTPTITTIASLTSNNSNIITSTRFLHLNNTSNAIPTPFSSNKKSNCVNINEDLLNNESPSMIQPTVGSNSIYASPQPNMLTPTIKLENLITLTPVVSTTAHTNGSIVNETPTISGGGGGIMGSGVVSRLKNWIGIRKNTPTTTSTTSTATNSTTTTTPSIISSNNNDLSSEASSSSSFKLTKLFLQQTSVDPSSIEHLGQSTSSATSSSTNISNKTPSELYFLTNNLDSIIEKKLKRPTSVPNSIDYNNAQEFQGI